MNSDSESRFPQVRLADVASVVRGSSPRPAGDPRFFNGDFLPWITVADLTSSDEPTLTSTLSKLTEEGAERTRIFEPGTVLLTNSGATLGVPKICGIRAGANDGIAGFLNLSAELDSFYLYYCLSCLTEHFRTKVASGVGQPNLNTELIGDVRVSKPPMDVQHAVVRVLTAWDRGIRQLTDLIAAKVRFKQGLMQQLLTGQRRFKAFSEVEWEPRPIGSFLTESRIPGSHGGDAKKVTVKLYGKGVIPKSDTRAGSAATKYYKRKAGQFIYSKLDFLNGAFGIVPEELDGYESTLDLPAFDFGDSVDPSWFRYFVIREGFYKNLLGLANGGRKARRVNPDDLLKVAIPFPSKKEQARIAQVLQTLDHEIDLLQQELDALKQQKKGLMQKLLTGEVRVKL